MRPEVDRGERPVKKDQNLHSMPCHFQSRGEGNMSVVVLSGAVTT